MNYQEFYEKHRVANESLLWTGDELKDVIEDIRQLEIFKDCRVEIMNLADRFGLTVEDINKGEK